MNKLNYKCKNLSMLLQTYIFLFLAIKCYCFNKLSANQKLNKILTMSVVPRNENFKKLNAGYLFPEIARRRKLYLEKNPEADIISLGIGDTTQPVPDHILEGLIKGVRKLGNKKTYSGYGAEQGSLDLREKIANKLYNNIIDPDDVFVSDGAKCDISRLQMMFGKNVISAVQDPSYPVYVDTSIIMGQTGEMDDKTKQYNGIVYMPCNPSNNFFPDVENLPYADVYYFCSPNNPTGATASRDQLERLVNYCNKIGSIIVFDAAYAPFIRTPGTPKSIYEIEGSKKCAIEVNSFSKYAGFTGVRLGWTVVPKELEFNDGYPVRNDWNRVMTTGFNGASNIVQQGGLACLDDEGLKEIDVLIEYYLTNSKLLRETFLELGFKVYGGTDAPYVFVSIDNKPSWETFNEVLESIQVVTIPGAGFGPGGEGFLRMSAFAPRESVIEACRRFKKFYGKKKHLYIEKDL